MIPKPDFKIAREVSFSPEGTPDKEHFSISAYVETYDEITGLGSIDLENEADLVALHNVLGTYIRMHGLAYPNVVYEFVADADIDEDEDDDEDEDEDEEEGGDGDGL